MSTKLAVAWIVVQIGFLAGWALYEQSHLLPGEGTSIVVRTRPVDPRDMLRGQYVALAYNFGRVSDFPKIPARVVAGDEVWAVLAPEKDSYVPVELLADAPAQLAAGQVVLRGTAKSSQSIEYGIESYFVPEGTETPNTNRLTVRLRIGKQGVARIEEVYLNGVPWP
jgi:uncharacterized membrane-anchored protein